MSVLKRIGCMLAVCAIAYPSAQTPGTRSIVVSETAGIRRTEYPTAAVVEIPRGALREVTDTRLRFNDADVPAQFTAESKWDDQSIRALGVDFNVSIGPAERRTYQLEYGSSVAPTAPTGRGLAVTEDTEAIQVGSIRLGKSGSPLVLAASYVKTNFIGAGQNGLSVIDRSGVRHDLSTARELTVEVVKRGPLKVVVRYAGRLPLDQTTTAPFDLTLEMPNSKSWLKMSAVIQDPQRRIRTIAFDSPLAFGALPWTWDFGTENGTYGAFRNATDTAVLSQPVNGKGAAGWIVRTGSEGEALRDYERSATGTGSHGWGHLLDARGAVAFGVADFGRRPGVYQISLNGRGQTSFSFETAQPATDHRLTVYQHFVSTPVPIGAATSPTAMLNPLKAETP